MTETMPDLDVNENSDIYYQGGYWNDLDAVVRRLNERISGDPADPVVRAFRGRRPAGASSGR